MGFPFQASVRRTFMSQIQALCQVLVLVGIGQWYQTGLRPLRLGEVTPSIPGPV